MPPAHTIDNSSSSSQGNKIKTLHKQKGKGSCDPEYVQELCSKESLSQLVKDLEKKPNKLEVVSMFVQNHKYKLLKWEKNIYYLKVCDLSGTIYMGQQYMKEQWEEFYLPKTTRMEVLGILEHSQVPLPCMEWVVLVGEDGCVYAYREEELQLIAKNLSEFVENGKKRVYATYDYPEFSDEDEETLLQDEEVQKIRQSTRDFVNSNAHVFDNLLNFLSSKQ
ncbi:uncharacterized protein [Engystomops pustulosus]|uniref:uncharacterized protein n=1 Tax=Engystomops pustulosus TaxID=76066 RepID=UPI003AFB5E73